MGKFKEKVDYAEILRRAGVEVPAMVDDASASAPASASEEDDRVNEDVQEATPAQGSTIVANDFSAQAGAVGYGPAQTGARGRTAQTRADTGAAETRKETQEKTVIRRSSKIPDPIVDTTVKPLPVVIKPQYTKRGMGGSGVLEEMDVTEACITEAGGCERDLHHKNKLFLFIGSMGPEDNIGAIYDPPDKLHIAHGYLDWI